jgi:hypothetical protein
MKLHIYKIYKITIMNKLLIVALVAGMLLGAVTAASLVEAKTYEVKVRAHYEKKCTPADIFYLRMADNKPDPKTGEHKLKIWKTPYFTNNKDKSYTVNVDTKKAPSGRIVTYAENYDGLPDGKSYKSDKAPPTQELWDQYIHQTLKKGLTVDFVIPALC